MVKPKLRMELITWHDHWSLGRGWHLQTEIDKEPMNCQSVGFVIHEDKTSVMLACSHDGQDPLGFSCIKYIIKSCIVSRKKLS